MQIDRHFTSLRSYSRFGATLLLFFLAVAIIPWPQIATGQQPAVPKLTQAQVEQLVSNKVPDSTLSTQIQKRGLTFAPTPAIVESLRAKGAGPMTLAAMVALFVSAAPSAATGRAAPANEGQAAQFGRIPVTVGGGFNNPFGVVVDSGGNVFVADTGNHAVKEIPHGCAAAICVRTLTGGYPFGVAVDASDNVFVADLSGVKEVLVTGGYTTVNSLGSGFRMPHGVSVDKSGNVFVAEFGDGAVGGSPGAIKEILPIGSNTTMTILGEGFNHPMGVAVDWRGNVFVADNQNNAVKEIPSGCALITCVKTLGSGFSYPVGVAVDGSGNVFVADSMNNAVKEILAISGYARVITLGSDFKTPMGVAVDKRGNVFVADRGNHRVVELEVADSNATPNAAVPSATSDASDGGAKPVVPVILQSFETSDCTEGELKLPMHPDASLVFVVSPMRECWTPWLALEGNFVGYQESGNILLQFAFRDGTIGDAFEDGPKLTSNERKPIQRIRFKSLRKEPVTITMGHQW